MSEERTFFDPVIDLLGASLEDPGDREALYAELTERVKTADLQELDGLLVTFRQFDHGEPVTTRCRDIIMRRFSEIVGEGATV